MRYIADAQEIIRERLRIDATPAAAKKHAAAGHRLHQRIEQPPAVKTGHAAETEVNRGISTGKKTRNLRRRRPWMLRQPLSAEMRIGRPVGRRGQQAG